jgi:hypothetical protein
MNSFSYSPAFNYPSIADALHHVTPGSFMCVAAHNDRGSFCIQYQGFVVLVIAHTAYPYYSRTFGAEYHRWFTHVYRCGLTIS